MKSTASYSLWRVAVVLALALGFTPRSEMQAQDSKAHEPQSKSTPAPAAKSSRGPQEGIKIHGHWVIEVRNPDGTLATRREFDNALSITGQASLVSLLGRVNSVGLWLIYFDGGGFAGAQHPCGGGACAITEGPGATLFASDVLVGTDLTATADTSASPAKLVLMGSGTVTTNGTVGRVMTRLNRCSNSVAPQTPCPIFAPQTAFHFTEASAPGAFPAANVVAGQVVQITVTFTFS